MKKLLILFFVMFLLSVCVMALGVSPARRTVSFSPSQVVEGSFKIINSEMIERELVIQTRGALGQNIQLDKRRVRLGGDEVEVVVNYRVVLPSELSPGPHIGEIVISEPTQDFSDENTIVGATLSLVTQVYVFIPYPGKYAQGVLNIESAQTSEDVLFKLSIVNLGEFDLTNVYANIDVYGELNEKIDSFNTNKIQIKTKEKGDIVYSWKADVPVGKYRAFVTLIYDGESKNFEETFQVGVKSLELEQINVQNFRLGEIIKMELLVENKWSEEIDGVFTQMQIFGSNGDLLADFNSPDTKIDALSKKVLVSYWDSAGVREGTYDAKAIIHYRGGKTGDKNLQLVVRSNSLEVIGLGYVLSEGAGNFNLNENLVMILVIIIGILILLNVLWFFILRRMMNKK